MIPKELTEEAGQTQKTFNNMVGGYDTRGRTLPKFDITSASIKQQKKKVVNVKSAYIPPQPLLPQALTLLALAPFSSLAEELQKNSVSRTTLLLPNNLLYTIYSQAQTKGGVLEISSIGTFESMARKLIIENSGETLYQVNQQIIEKIRLLLFSIQFVTLHPEVEKKIYELGLVNFVGKEQLRLYAKNKIVGLAYFNNDLTLFQEGAESLQIDKSIFNLDFMCEYYKKQKIDIRVQSPLDYGFKPAKLKNKKYEMTLGEYRFYQLNYTNAQKMKGFKHLSELGKEQVFFGVNFEPSDQMLNKEIKKNVDGTFLDFHGDFDLMSYLDFDIPGCSIPQMYFKTPGCWTGGHQEDINMSALNINHGPDASEWYTLDLKYVDKLRKELIQKFGTDLYTAEGLWYERLDWFISRGYPVKRFLQRKDDIVVTGPGTLHWVRCFGLAMQTSWNIFPKNYQQFVTTFERHRINKQMNYWKRDVIPLKSLIKKYLNHERTLMSTNSRLLIVNKLEEWLREQTDGVETFLQRVDKKVEYYLKDQQSFCVCCRQQVLLYFLPAPVSFERGICCVSCYQMKQGKLGGRIAQLYFKHDIYSFELLLQISKNQLLNKNQPNEIEQLCKGVHVGDLPIKCKVYLKREGLPFMDSEPGEFENIEEINNAEREIFYPVESQFLFNLYEKFSKHLTDMQKDLEKVRILCGDRLRPATKSKKMMQMGGNCEIFNDAAIVVKKKLFVDQEIQTEVVFQQMEAQPREITEKKSQSRSRSREKKKKKNKQGKQKKTKKNKKKGSSPKFSQDSKKQLQNKSRRSSRSPRDSPESRRNLGNDRKSNSNRNGEDWSNNRGYDGGNNDRRSNNNWNRNDSQGGSDRYGDRPRRDFEDNKNRSGGNWNNRDNEGNNYGGSNNRDNNNGGSNNRDNRNKNGRYNSNDDSRAWSNNRDSNRDNGHGWNDRDSGNGGYNNRDGNEDGFRERRDGNYHKGGWRNNRDGNGNGSEGGFGWKNYGDRNFGGENGGGGRGRGRGRGGFGGDRSSDQNFNGGDNKPVPSNGNNSDVNSNQVNKTQAPDEY